MMSNDRNNRDTSHVPEIPGGEQFQKFVTGFNKFAAKKIASQAGPALYRLLAGGTELFFRRDLGERYADGNFIGGGIALWMIGTMGSFTLALIVGSPLTFLLRLTGIPIPGGNAIAVVISLLAGLGLLSSYAILLKQNKATIQRYRSSRTLYHSRSRGQPRWGKMQGTLRVAVSGILLLCAPLLGIAFIASLCVTARLVAIQQQALWDSYLDAQDAKIRALHFRDAMLGKCAPEITDLYQALSTEYDEKLREDIADANTDGPAQSVAEPPKSGGAPYPVAHPQEEHSSRAMPKAENAVPTQSRPRSSRGRKKVVRAETTAEDDEVATIAVPNENTACSPGGVAANLTQPLQKDAGSPNKSNRMPTAAKVLLLAMIMTSITGVYIGYPLLRKQRVQNTPDPAPVPAFLATVAGPGVAQTNLVAPEKTVPVPKPAAVPAQPPPEDPAITAARVRAEREAKEREEAEQRRLALVREQLLANERLLDQMRTSIAEQLAQFNKFKAECSARLSENTNKIAKAGFLARRSLRKENDKVRNDFQIAMDAEERDLVNMQKLFKDASPDAAPRLQATMNSYNTVLTMTKQQHNRILAALDAVDAAISKASGGGLLQLKVTSGK